MKTFRKKITAILILICIAISSLSLAFMSAKYAGMSLIDGLRLFITGQLNDNSPVRGEEMESYHSVPAVYHILYITYNTDGENVIAREDLYYAMTDIITIPGEIEDSVNNAFYGKEDYNFLGWSTTGMIAYDTDENGVVSYDNNFTKLYKNQRLAMGTLETERSVARLMTTGELLGNSDENITIDFSEYYGEGVSPAQPSHPELDTLSHIYFLLFDIYEGGPTLTVKPHEDMKSALQEGGEVLIHPLVWFNEDVMDYYFKEKDTDAIETFGGGFASPVFSEGITFYIDLEYIKTQSDSSAIDKAKKYIEGNWSQLDSAATSVAITAAESAIEALIKNDSQFSLSLYSLNASTFEAELDYDTLYQTLYNLYDQRIISAGYKESEVSYVIEALTNHCLALDDESKAFIDVYAEVYISLITSDFTDAEAVFFANSATKKSIELANNGKNSEQIYTYVQAYITIFVTLYSESDNELSIWDCDVIADVYAEKYCEMIEGGSTAEAAYEVSWIYAEFCNYWNAQGVQLDRAKQYATVLLGKYFEISTEIYDSIYQTKYDEKYAELEAKIGVDGYTEEQALIDADIYAQECVEDVVREFGYVLLECSYAEKYLEQIALGQTAENADVYAEIYANAYYGLRQDGIGFSACDVYADAYATAYQKLIADGRITDPDEMDEYALNYASLYGQMVLKQGKDKTYAGAYAKIFLSRYTRYCYEGENKDDIIQELTDYGVVVPTEETEKETLVREYLGLYSSVYANSFCQNVESLGKEEAEATAKTFADGYIKQYYEMLTDGEGYSDTYVYAYLDATIIQGKTEAYAKSFAFAYSELSSNGTPKDLLVQYSTYYADTIEGGYNESDAYDRMEKYCTAHVYAITILGYSNDKADMFADAYVLACDVKYEQFLLAEGLLDGGLTQSQISMEIYSLKYATSYLKKYEQKIAQGITDEEAKSDAASYASNYADYYAHGFHFILVQEDENGEKKFSETFADKCGDMYATYRADLMQSVEKDARQEAKDYVYQYLANPDLFEEINIDFDYTWADTEFADIYSKAFLEAEELYKDFLVLENVSNVLITQETFQEVYAYVFTTKYESLDTSEGFDKEEAMSLVRMFSMDCANYYAHAYQGISENGQYDEDTVKTVSAIYAYVRAQLMEEGGNVAREEAKNYVNAYINASTLGNTQREVIYDDIYDKKINEGYEQVYAEVYANAYADSFIERAQEMFAEYIVNGMTEDDAVARVYEKAESYIIPFAELYAGTCSSIYVETYKYLCEATDNTAESNASIALSLVELFKTRFADVHDEVRTEIYQELLDVQFSVEDARLGTIELAYGYAEGYALAYVKTFAIACYINGSDSITASAYGVEYAKMYLDIYESAKQKVMNYYGIDWANVSTASESLQLVIYESRVYAHTYAEKYVETLAYLVAEDNNLTLLENEKYAEVYADAYARALVEDNRDFNECVLYASVYVSEYAQRLMDGEADEDARIKAKGYAYGYVESNNYYNYDTQYSEQYALQYSAQYDIKYQELTARIGEDYTDEQAKADADVYAKEYAEVYAKAYAEAYSNEYADEYAKLFASKYVSSYLESFNEAKASLGFGLGLMKKYYVLNEENQEITFLVHKGLYVSANSSQESGEYDTGTANDSGNKITAEYYLFLYNDENAIVVDENGDFSLVVANDNKCKGLLVDKDVVLYAYDTTPDGKHQSDDGMLEVACFTTGTLITLADGSHKAVEDLTETDILRVYDHEQGLYVYMPALVINFSGNNVYNVASLDFADGTTLEIINERGLFDITLNKYVYITPDNCKDYVGHKFAKETDSAGGFVAVELVSARSTFKFTGCYSVASGYYINHFINGYLTVPGGYQWFVNYFEYGDGTVFRNGDNLKYNEKLFAEDIEKYGLLTIQEIIAIMPEVKELFTAEEIELLFNYVYPAKYLKVAIGKGLVSFDEIFEIVNNYIVDNNLSGRLEQIISQNLAQG